MMNDSYYTPLVNIPGQEIPIMETPNQIPIEQPVNNETISIVKSPKLSFMNTLYIGSLTVVGLFIVFRFIQKSR